MPPAIEYYPTENAFWGLGLERFGFSGTPPEAKDWWQNVATSNFTPDQLQTVPDSALAILRNAAAISLLKQQSLAVGKGNKYQNTEVEWLTGRAFPLKTANIKPNYTESRDNGGTTDYVTPLKTDKGILEIVLNPAWGISWRLSPAQPKETPFAAAVTQYPQLAVTLPEDRSQPPKDGDRYQKPRFLSSHLLSEATRERINFKTVTADLNDLLTDLLISQDTEFSSGSINSSNNLLLPDSGFSCFTIANPAQGVEVGFWLGKEHGTKFVDIHGYQPFKADHLSPLAQKALTLKKIIKPLHYLP